MRTGRGYRMLKRCLAKRLKMSRKYLQTVHTKQDVWYVFPKTVTTSPSTYSPQLLQTVP